MHLPCLSQGARTRRVKEAKEESFYPRECCQFIHHNDDDILSILQQNLPISSLYFICGLGAQIFQSHENRNQNRLKSRIFFHFKHTFSLFIHKSSNSS